MNFAMAERKGLKTASRMEMLIYKKTILATHIHFAMTIALMNTEKEHLRLTIALSVVESWCSNGGTFK